jgi:hypothetical protein
LLGLEWRSPAATETKTRGRKAIGAEVDSEGGASAVDWGSNGLDIVRSFADSECAEADSRVPREVVKHFSTFLPLFG